MNLRPTLLATLFWLGLTLNGGAQSQQVKTFLQQAEAAAKSRNKTTSLNLFEQALAAALNDEEKAIVMFARAQAEIKFPVLAPGEDSSTAYARHKAEHAKLHQQILELPEITQEQKLRAHQRLIAYYKGEKQAPELLAQRRVLLELPSLPSAIQAEQLRAIAGVTESRTERRELWNQALSLPGLEDGAKTFILMDLARDSERAKRYDEAFELYQAVVELQGASPAWKISAQLSSIEMELRSGKNRLAIKRAQRLLKEQESLKNVENRFYDLAELMSKLGQKESAAKLHSALFEHAQCSALYREKSGLVLARLAREKEDFPEAHRYYELLPGSYSATTQNLGLYSAEKNHAALAQFYSQAVERERADKTRLGDKDYENNRLWGELNKIGLQLTKFYSQSPEHKQEVITVLQALRKLQIPNSRVIQQIDAELKKRL